MRRTLIALVLLLAPAVAHAAPSEINAVTVFADRAEVTRTLTAEVPAGASEVAFTGLPMTLAPESLRVAGESRGAAVTLGAIASEVVTSRDLTDAREQALTATLEGLEDTAALLDAQEEGLNARYAFLEALGQQAALRSDEAIAELRLNPEDWAAAAQVLGAQVGEVLAAQVELAVRRRTLERDMDKVRADLAQLRTGQRQTYTVTVPVEAASAAPLTLRLTYQVHGASWRPIYDARLSTGDGALVLTQYGEVAQRTGEDWDGVALTLSTARPAAGTALPSLTPQWVNIYDPAARPVPPEGAMYMGRLREERVVSSNVMHDKIELDALMPASVSSEPLERWKQLKAEQAQATIEGGEFVAARYAIPGPARVPSGGRAVKVKVGDFALASTLEVHVKPQLSGEAFLAARATLAGDAPILPGVVKLFRDGEYVGQGALDLLRPGDEEVLFFGVDDKVAVERETLADARADAGMLVRENTLERAYVTEITNLHAGPVTVVVKETIPAPRNTDLRVDVLAKGTRAGYAQDYADIAGLLAWRFEAAPGATERVGLAWRLTWPKGREVSGL
jgi:uncharacterized protein (TIGR02231 family)